ncbi:MAG: sensor histidine kinase [Clostridia bacterium]|nr:sensor histidine kinase [Clostridia bacterium]
MFKTIRDYWYMLSIKNKQLFFFAIIILFVSLISFYSQQTTVGFMNKYYHYLSKYYKINKLFNDISDNKQYVERFIREMSREDLDKYRASVKMINELIAEIDKETDSLDTYLQINAIKNSTASYFEGCDSAIGMRMERDEDYYKAFYDAVHINDYIKGYVQQLLYITLKEGNWAFSNQIVPKANNVKIITLVSIIAISVLCLAFALIFSAYLTKPIRKLAAASQKMSKGDLDVKEVVVKSTDEVGILASSFNKMNVSIKQLVEDLTEKSNLERKLHDEELKNIKMQQLLKDAEFLALQSQINPHFLFNTLNIISRTAMFEQAENTTKLIQALSTLFRYNLGKSDKSTTLEKELDITMEYMYIQQYRFGERIKLDVKCQTQTDAVLIPCFTIQPLVENSIIHGLEPKENGGKLRIKVSRKGARVIVKIIDNGVGIPRDKIRRMMNMEEEMYAGHTTGIGLTNVMNRLGNYFSGRSEFKISSKVGIGTVITMVIPAGKEVENFV